MISLRFAMKKEKTASLTLTFRHRSILFARNVSSFKSKANDIGQLPTASLTCQSSAGQSVRTFSSTDPSSSTTAPVANLPTTCSTFRGPPSEGVSGVAAGLSGSNVNSVVSVTWTRTFNLQSQKSLFYGKNRSNYQRVSSVSEPSRYC